MHLTVIRLIETLGTLFELHMLSHQLYIFYLLYFLRSSATLSLLLPYSLLDCKLLNVFAFYVARNAMATQTKIHFFFIPMPHLFSPYNVSLHKNNSA